MSRSSVTRLSSARRRRHRTAAVLLRACCGALSRHNNNDLFNTPDSENATVVGRLYQDVVDEIRKGSEKASIPVDALSVIYYRGPSYPSWVTCPFDSAIGWSNWLSARHAVASVESKIANLDYGVREVCGKRPGITSCVSKPVANEAVAVPGSHLPAASAGE